MKREYKVLLCYFIACVCFTLAKNPAASGNPHVPMADSLLFYLLVSPIYAPVSISLSLFDIFFADTPPGVFERIKVFLFGVFALAVPLVIALMLAFKRLPGIVDLVAEARDTRETLTKRGGSTEPSDQIKAPRQEK